MNLVKSLLVFALATSALLAQAETKFTFYTEQFPPYNMTSDGKAFAHKAEKISGLCTDIIKQMIPHLPFKTQIKLRNWDYAINKVKQKTNHGLFCTVRSPERENSFQWVGPLTNIRWTLFAKPDSNIELNTLEDAHKYRIGGYNDDVMTLFLQKNQFNVSSIANDSVNPKRLLLGQIDLWVADELSGPFVASDSADIDDLKPVLIFKDTPLYLALNNQTDAEVVSALVSAFEKVRKSGQIEVIERTYGR
ncbi:MAG: ABC transporter substrate-binding protein [Gammaproteobacteria bacterium]|nr:ABC transporter substrate-binding protein [Gammaproteobacteria bacterium]